MSSNQSILDLRDRFNNIAVDGSKALLHSTFPNDVEYYLCSIELLEIINGSEPKTFEYFTFPIMPENIKISDSKVQTTSKTLEGVVVIENNTFTPKTITINGNFGRKIKMLNLELSFDSQRQEFANFKEANSEIKTGYGVMKRLQRIIENSSYLLNGNPILAMFYCYAFNAHYVVQFNSNSFEQSVSKNMIWEYNLNMTAIAPANQILGNKYLKDTLNKYLKRQFIQNSIKQTTKFAFGQTKILTNQLLMKIS